MEITTSYPVYINKQRINKPSEYLSFDGKSATKAQILAFQKFANTKGYFPKLVEDGAYGAKTQKAIDVWGAEFDKAAQKLQGIAQGVMNPPVIPAGGTPTQAQVDAMKKQGMTWDKVKGGWQKGKDILSGLKNIFGGGQQAADTATAQPSTDMPVADQPAPTGMSKTMKIALIGGGVVVLGLIIWAVSRGSSKGK